jgi:MFS transporter, PAT family, beta-lactamase induction signal transducer AmpG
MQEPQFEPRGIPAPYYAVLFLPGGLAGGFVTVTLGYVLGRHGVSVAAIAGLAGLYLLPTTWQFFVGPVVDMTLTRTRWYIVGSLVLAACFVAFALTPMTAAGVPALGVVCFAIGVATVAQGTAGVAAMVATTPPEKRGPIAGWSQTANLGGAGLGGGLALWIVSHAGGAVAAALTLSVLSIACAAPIFLMRVPPIAKGESVLARTRGLTSEVWILMRTRVGVLAAIAMTIPAALGAATRLLPAVAGDWRASADLVALVQGALGGVASIPGCILGGYLCIRWRHRTVYMWAALAFAAGEAVMALAPHTPTLFAVLALANSVLLGVCYGALSGIIFDALGPRGAATVGSILSSLSNVPLLAVTILVGQAQTRLGSGGMLLTESGLAAVSIAGYALLAFLWKPGTTSRAPAYAAAVT